MSRCVVLFAWLSCWLLVAGAGAEEKITFVKEVLDTRFRSEGVAVGDFNRDGKLDIAAGYLYYAAPDWKPVPVVKNPPPEFNPKGYSASFVNDAEDLNGDGWVDLLVVGFPGKETQWYENPRGKPGLWKRHVIIDDTCNESPTFADIDGDGRREFICASHGFYGFARRGEDPTAPWSFVRISQRVPRLAFKYYHGLGVGDINGDGRPDVVLPDGWWEAPKSPDQTPWKFHPAKLGGKAAQMHVYDFDGDGDQDVLSSSAHAFGIWWHEQTPEGWVTHEIDSSFSQTHALCLADINGDGLPDFVTGKRWWAHGGRDPGGDQPAVMYWYELRREGGKVRWIPHLFDHNSGVGTQFVVRDVDGDGLLDVVTSNKKGVFFFRQVRK